MTQLQENNESRDMTLVVRKTKDNELCVDYDTFVKVFPEEEIPYHIILKEKNTELEQLLKKNNPSSQIYADLVKMHKESLLFSIDLCDMVLNNNFSSYSLKVENI